ncbi:MAG: C13 family peptidase, partial [Anaerolineae bacterium]
AQDNTIGPHNVIAFNRTRGIGVWDTTTVRNRITQNAIYANTIMGIDTGQGGNTEPSSPVITAVTTNSVTGIAPFANARVEVFSDEASQGRVYEGFVMAGADGRFTFSKPAGLSGPFLTATATDAVGNTSEFATAVSKPRPAGADAFETDDSCAQARQALTDGTVQAHTFHQAGDTDWVRFQATAGSEYLIEGQIPVSSPTDLQAELYDQCNGVVRAVQDHAFAAGIRIRYQAPLSGPLFLRLVNHSPSIFGAHVAYDLSVRVLSHTTTPGALIIVAGRLRESDALQTNIHHVSNAVRTAFLNQGYDDSRVYYLATNLGLPGVDGAATKANLRTAITTWALDKVGPDRALTLYLVDHGTYDRFYLDAPRGEWVAPDEVDQWLTQLETARPGVRVNVIIEACYSGSFIDPPHRLSKSGRVVIASTTNNDLAWSSADGAVFSDHFIEAIGQQQSLFTSFQTSRWAARQAHSLQEPWLDDNGDGVYNELQDGAEAARRGFAYAGTFPDLWPPYIIEASGSVNAGNTTGVIRARVLDDVSVRSVWAIIYPPSYQPPPPGSTWGQDILPTLRLLPQGNGWFAASYPGFTEPGLYHIVIYADDHTDLDAQPQALSVRTGPHSYLPWVQ